MRVCLKHKKIRAIRLQSLEGGATSIWTPVSSGPGTQWLVLGRPWLADCVFLTRPPPSFWLHHMYSLVWKGIEILRASHHCLTLCLQALQPSVLSGWSVPCMCPSHACVPPIGAHFSRAERWKWTFQVCPSPGYMSMVTCSFNQGWGF